MGFSIENQKQELQSEKNKDNKQKKENAENKEIKDTEKEDHVKISYYNKKKILQSTNYEINIPK